MTDTWWNINYPIRRNIRITALNGQPILEGHPVYCFFDKDQLITLNKVRENFEDLEVFNFSGNEATPVWTRVPREVIYDGQSDLITIVFNVIDNIATEDTNYYLYMANDILVDFTLRPQYTSAVYVVKVTPQDPLGIMFSKPGEDWVDGYSVAREAKATLGFLGINIRLTIEKGPDKGIIEIKLDEEQSISVDCYSPIVQESVVFEKNNLSKQRHYLRMTVTGNKSPNSLGNSIKIISAEYSKFVEAIDQGEEFYSLTGSINAIVGL